MKAEDRKQQILDAALKAFAEHGYERTSIATICNLAGIARPTLYQYFNDKKSVFRELLEGYYKRIHDKVHPHELIRTSKGSFKDGLLAIHTNLFREIFDNREIYTILIKEARARNAESQDVLRDIMKSMVDEYVTEMSPLASMYKNNVLDLEFFAVYMLGGVFQLIEYYLIDNNRSITAEEFAEKVTEIEYRVFAHDQEINR